MKEIYKDDSILEHPEVCPDCGYDVVDCSCEDYEEPTEPKGNVEQEFP